MMNKVLLEKKKEKRIIIFFQVFILLFFIILWQILSDMEIINTFLYSSPKNVISTIVSLYNKHELFSHISITLYEIAFSFFLGSIIGILFAGILWWFKRLSKILDPYLTILNSVPKVALGPLIIIIVGANTSSVIVMALLISVISTIIGVYSGFKDTNKSYVTLLKSFHAKKIEIFKNVVLPYNFNNIISLLKINLSLTFVGVIMGELLVSKKGLGYLINYGSQIFNLNLVITSIILLALLTSFLYIIILFIEKKLKKEW